MSNFKITIRQVILFLLEKPGNITKIEKRILKLSTILLVCKLKILK